jgi:hypothetical protein
LITRRLILGLGLSQLACWGLSYYLIGVFGGRIAAETGWSLPVVHAGFSLALVVMGIASPWVGRQVERQGGRPVMAAGSLLLALGCAGLAAAHGLILYYLAWACLGLAMRMTLYDAAFAALACIGGPAARRPIAQITLLGGLASTVFWPVGHLLADRLGWRGALLAYAGLALLTLPLHLAIPAGRHALPKAAAGSAVKATSANPLAATLYALIVTLTSFLNSAMSAHMITLLEGLGLLTATAVGIAALRGIGQSLARLAEVLFGSRLHPLSLNLLAACLLLAGFLAGLPGTYLLAAGFAFLYGTGNGLLTITRGTMPLVLFDPAAYGSLTGRLLVPSFLGAALAPFAYALLIEQAGTTAALLVSLAAAGLILTASLVLKGRFGRAHP